MKRVLIVDDDQTLCDLLAQFLHIEDFFVSCLHHGDDVIPWLKQHESSAEKPDVIVLDIMLPGQTGLDILKATREFSQIPILMLTARGEDTDRILGLELGADDYLPKPCNPKELSARIKAILRRTASPDTPQQQSPSTPETADEKHRITIRDTLFILDPQARRATFNHQEIRLTATEFDLLHTLLNQPDITLTKQVLSSEVLGKPLESYDRSLDMHVSNLRRKIPSEIARQIETIRGVGYRYTPAALF